MQRLLLLMITTLLSGCGTCCNVCSTFSKGNEILQGGWSTPEKRVYGGVAMDARFGTGLIRHEAMNDLWAGPLGLYVLAVDLPLSFLGDTLTLPATIPASIDRAINEYYFPDTGRQGEHVSENVQAP